MVSSKNYKGTISLTLTSQKLVIEKETGIFKKVRKLLEIIEISDIKIYNGAAQVKQKAS